MKYEIKINARENCAKFKIHAQQEAQKTIPALSFYTIHARYFPEERIPAW